MNPCTVFFVKYNIQEIFKSANYPTSIQSISLSSLVNVILHLSFDRLHEKPTSRQVLQSSFFLCYFLCHQIPIRSSSLSSTDLYGGTFKSCESENTKPRYSFHSDRRGKNWEWSCQVRFWQKNVYLRRKTFISLLQLSCFTSFPSL